jgi:hypothetical protein
LLGLALVGGITIDALWTTLWVDGHAGPFSGRVASGLRLMMWKAVPPEKHRLLSLTGPVVLVLTVLLWALVMWTGWTLAFSADPGSLRDPHTGQAATLAGRIYFTGYTMFTLGNGDYGPRGGWWQFLTSVTSLSGLFLVTLAVTYMLAVLEAVVAKRSFASHVTALGGSAEEMVLNSWDGRCFRDIELQIVSLTEQLNTVTEQHQAYPMLHYYHEARRQQSVPVGLAIFDVALTLLAEGVAPEVRPAPSALRAARVSVDAFLETLESAYVDPAEHSAGPPDLDRLRAGGIPTVSDAEFEQTMQRREKHRRLLMGFLEGEKRKSPESPGARREE